MTQFLLGLLLGVLLGNPVWRKMLITNIRLLAQSGAKQLRQLTRREARQEAVSEMKPMTPARACSLGNAAAADYRDIRASVQVL